MKKLILLCAVVALAASCNKYDGPSEKRYSLLSRSEERTGADVRITDYEYDGIVQTKETQILNRTQVIYVEQGYEYNASNLTTTYYRTIPATETEPEQRQRRVLSYKALSGGGTIAYKLEAFLLGDEGSETVPVEKWEKDFDTRGNLTNYKYSENGTLVLEQYDFVYDATGITWKERENDQVRIMHQQDEVTNGDVTGFELYIDWNTTSQSGKLIEVQNQFTLNNIGQATYYKHKIYDPETEELVSDTAVYNSYISVTIDPEAN